MSRRAATLIGLIAVLMWAVLALFSAASGEVPPFQLAAMTFLIGGLLGALSYLSPLVSTVILATAGFAPAHWSVAVACLLITAGAAIAAKDMLFRQR